MRYGIDIFSGAGGLSLGAEMAGIRIGTAIEINPYAAKTFQRNHKKAKVLQGDIQKIDPKALHEKGKSIFVRHLLLRLIVFLYQPFEFE